MMLSAEAATRRILQGLPWGVIPICLWLTACQQQMADQPRYEPLVESQFFEDGRAARPLVEGTVARGHLNADEHFHTGKINRKPAETFPFPIDRQVLLRGQERYNIFCSPCHDQVGNGQGMVVRRGYRPPPSFHIDRLRSAPAGYLFDIISHGFGAMPDYAEQISARDRWAIVAYVRALQLSQQAKLADVSDKERRLLLEKKK
jgi:hypothetical protein